MLCSAAASIAQAAGWTTPAPDAAGVITFRLAEGLRLELFSPDGRSIILCGTVCSLPADACEADALVEKALRYAAAGGRRRSILSLSPVGQPSAEVAEVGDVGDATEVTGSKSRVGEKTRKLVLHRVLQTIDPKTHKDEFFAGEAEGLLNDLDWWRGHLIDDTQHSGSSIRFDGGFGAFPSLGFPLPYSEGSQR